MNDVMTDQVTTIEGGLSVWCPLFPLELAYVGDDFLHVPLPPIPVNPCGQLPWDVQF